MRSRRFLRLLSFVCFTGMLLFTLSCGDDGPTDNGNPDDGGCGPDAAGARLKAAEGNAALELVLYDELNPWEPDRPDDVDLREPNRLYTEALALDTCNRDAHFGAAVTGLLTLSTDAEVNAAFDEWKAYLDDHVPFEVPSAEPGFLGVPMSFTNGRTALRLPFDLVPLSLVAQVHSSMRSDDPRLGRVQAILEEKVLPRLQEAQDHLAAVLQDSTFTYIVTGRMQGDVEDEPVELDRTDFLALRAACSLLTSVCRVAVSYQLEMAAYDSLSLSQAMAPGSGWLALRSGGAAQMQQARVDLEAAVDHVDEAISSLLAERDSQSDDVIKIGPDDLSRADVESVRVNLPHVRELLDTGYTRLEDWDGNSHTPEVSLRINVGELFRTPVQDWKALLPEYTYRIERRVWDSDWNNEAGSTVLQVNVPAAGFYSYSSFYRYVYHGGDDQSGFYGNEFMRDAMEQFVSVWVQRVQSTPGWTGEFSGNIYFNGGDLQAGSELISVQWNGGYGVATKEVYTPILVWDATEFDGWIWPDPTFSGLLPDMGSTPELMSLFGINGDGWDREWVLDWSGSGNTGTVPPVPPPDPYVAQSSPGAVLANLETSCEERNTREYEALFAADFAFAFSPLDVQDPQNPTPAQWGRADEMASASHLFQSDRVENIYLSWSPGTPEASDDVIPNSWKVRVDVVNFDVVTRTELGELWIYQVRGAYQDFYFRETDVVLPGGAHRWDCIRWEDSPIHGGKVEDMTWGRIKNHYR